MRVVDLIAGILKREGVKYLNCYPTTVLIEAAASIGIRPIVCRQERVGVGIADGYARVTNGAAPSVTKSTEQINVPDRPDTRDVPAP